MTNYTQLIAMLARDFTVARIMIPLEHLVIVSSVDECVLVSERHIDLDVFPFIQKGAITGYWERGKAKIFPLTPKCIVTNSTTIFDLIDLLQKRHFYFVMEGSRIIGYVHRTDLNNDLLKIPFYILLQSLEASLLTRLDLKFSDLSLLQNKTRAQFLASMHNERKSKDIHLGSIQGLYLSEILEISIQRGVVEVPGKLKHLLEEFRNRVSHADKSLFQDSNDMVKLKEVKDYCINHLECN